MTVDESLPQTDEALILLAQSTDVPTDSRNAALVELWSRHFRAVLHSCHLVLDDRDRHLADDSMQETFLTMTAKIHKLEDPNALRSWLQTIARRHALKQIRFRNAGHRTDQRPLPDVEPTSDMIARRAAEQTVHHMFRDVSRALPEDQQSVFIKYFRESLRGQELAKRLGCSPAQATNRTYRLKKKLLKLHALTATAQEGARDCALIAQRLLESNIDVRDGLVLDERAVTLVEKHLEGCPGCAQRHRRVQAERTPLVLPALLGGAHEHLGPDGTGVPFLDDDRRTVRPQPGSHVRPSFKRMSGNLDHGWPAEPAICDVAETTESRGGTSAGGAHENRGPDGTGVSFFHGDYRRAARPQPGSNARPSSSIRMSGNLDHDRPAEPAIMGDLAETTESLGGAPTVRPPVAVGSGNATSPHASHSAQTSGGLLDNVILFVEDITAMVIMVVQQSASVAIRLGNWVVNLYWMIH